MCSYALCNSVARLTMTMIFNVNVWFGLSRNPIICCSFPFNAFHFMFVSYPLLFSSHISTFDSCQYNAAIQAWLRQSIAFSLLKHWYILGFRYEIFIRINSDWMHSLRWALMDSVRTLIRGKWWKCHEWQSITRPRNETSKRVPEFMVRFDIKQCKFFTRHMSLSKFTFRSQTHWMHSSH